MFEREEKGESEKTLKYKCNSKSRQIHRQEKKKKTREMQNDSSQYVINIVKKKRSVMTDTDCFCQIKAAAAPLDG